MCVAGVSTRRAGAVARELGVSSLSSSEVSSLCPGLDAGAGRFRARDLGGGPHAYVWLDATCMRCRVGGRYVSRAPVTAIGPDREGRKEFLGAERPDAESHGGWRGFLSGLRERGLEGVRLVVSDDHAGLVRAVREVFCGCAWQRCVTHLQRNVLGHVRSAAGRAAAADPVGAATTQRDPLVARAVWDAAEPWVSSLSAAAGRVFSEAREDALAFMSFPEAHWAKIRTDNVQERANREIKRRYRAARSFPSEDSTVRLVCSVLMGEEGRWAAQRVFSPESAALALAPAPDPGEPTAERLAAARLRAAEVVREVVDRRGLEM
jgi:transposase-like protein